MSNFESSIILYRALLSKNHNDSAEILKKEIESKYQSQLSRSDYLGQKHPLDLDSFLSRYPNINNVTFDEILKQLKSHADSQLPFQLPVESYLLSGPQSLVRTQETLNNECIQYKVNSLPCKRLHGPAYPNKSVNILKHIQATRLRGPVGIRRSVPVEFYSRTVLYRRIFGHLAPVYCVTFDMTGQFIFTGADDYLIKIWSARDGRLLSTLRGHSGEITDLSINFENQLLASGSTDKYIRIWDLRTGKMIECLNTHTAMITSVKFSPYNRHGSDRYLISTSNDGTVVFWTYHVNNFGFRKLKKLQERKRPGAQMVCSSFSVGGSFLACGSSDNSVYVYAFTPHSDPYKLLELEPHSNQVDSIQFCNHGFRFVSGSKDGTAIIWSYRKGDWKHIRLQMSDNPDENLHVSMVNWSKDDKYVITSLSDHSIKIWDSNNGQLMHVLKQHEQEVYLIEVHPIDPRIFLTGGHDGKIVLWDIERGITLKVFQNKIDSRNAASLYDCKFSPDGTMFVVTDSYGHLSLFGFGSDTPYQSIPDQMFFNYDYRGLVRDLNNFVMDEQTSLPPHLMSEYMQLVDMNGAPHPREFQYLVPNFKHADLIAPITDYQRQFIHKKIKEHSYAEDEEFLREKSSSPSAAGTSEINQKFINSYSNPPANSALRHSRRPQLARRTSPLPMQVNSRTQSSLRQQNQPSRVIETPDLPRRSTTSRLRSRRQPSPTSPPPSPPASSSPSPVIIRTRRTRTRVIRERRDWDHEPQPRSSRRVSRRIRYFEQETTETEEDEPIVRPQTSRQATIHDGETTEVETDSTEINYELPQQQTIVQPIPTRASARIRQKYKGRKRRRYH